MSDLHDFPSRAYRLAGCFSPQEIRVLDRVVDETLGVALGRARGRPGPVDAAEIRISVASLILSSAATGDLDPERLKAAALAALDLPAEGDGICFRTDRATG